MRFVPGKKWVFVKDYNSDCNSDYYLDCNSARVGVIVVDVDVIIDVATVQDFTMG